MIPANTGTKTAIPFPPPHPSPIDLHPINQAGGSLRVHADFNRLKGRYQLDRRVNIFVYLNDDYEDSHGGALELWDRSMTRRATTIAPLFNRFVVFASTDFSYHGHPEPWANTLHPRRSLALYLYTNGGRPASEVQGDPTCMVHNCIPVRVENHATLWQSQPGFVSPQDRMERYDGSIITPSKSGE